MTPSGNFPLTWDAFCGINCTVAKWGAGETGALFGWRGGEREATPSSFRRTPDSIRGVAVRGTAAPPSRHFDRSRASARRPSRHFDRSRAPARRSGETSSPWGWEVSPLRAARSGRNDGADGRPLRRPYRNRPETPAIPGGSAQNVLITPFSLDMGRVLG